MQWTRSLQDKTFLNLSYGFSTDSLSLPLHVHTRFFMRITNVDQSARVHAFRLAVNFRNGLHEYVMTDEVRVSDPLVDDNDAMSRRAERSQRTRRGSGRLFFRSTETLRLRLYVVMSSKDLPA